MTTKRNFDFIKLKSNKSKVFREFREDNLDDVVDQLKDNITSGTYFKNTPIGNMTNDVRALRGISSQKPLVAKGTLLKSIKKRGKNIVAKGYGHMQDKGYEVNDGKEHAFYAPKKKKESWVKKDDDPPVFDVEINNRKKKKKKDFSEFTFN